MKVTVTWYDPETEIETDYEAEGWVTHNEGRSYGPPENCYPAETDVEVTAVYLNGTEVPFQDIPDDLIKNIEEKLIEYHFDSCDDEPEYEPDPYND